MAGLKTRVMVLIPAYNEARHIAAVVRGVAALGYPVLVVDDGSKDATADEAARGGAEVLRRARNEGKGAAITDGVARFLAGRGDVLVLMDADGQHDPKDLEALAGPVLAGRAQMTLGNRMGDAKGMPFIRAATNRFMSWLLSGASGNPVPDTQCGYRAISREALARMELRSKRFEIESEILLEAARLKIPVVSVPVRSVYGDEKSHIRPVPDTIRFFKFILTYLVSRSRRKRS